MLACRDNKFGIVEKLLELGNPVNDLDKVSGSFLFIIDQIHEKPS